MRQEPLFLTVSSDWKPPQLGDLPRWGDAKRIAVDTESRDEQLRRLGPGVGIRKDAYTVGVSFAIEDGPKFYLPLRHEGGDNMPLESTLAYLRGEAASFTGTLIGANFGYDQQGLASDEIHFPNATGVEDVLLAAPLINELHDSYSLESVLTREGMAGKTEDALRAAALDYGINPKSEMWRLPARFVGVYAEDDAAKLHPLARRQQHQIEDQDLQRVFELECKLQPILTRMRMRGVRIDERQLERVSAWALAEEGKALARVHDITGIRIGVGDTMKPNVIAPALMYTGIKLIADAKGKYSIDQAVLAAIDHEVARCIERARKMFGLRSKFSASIYAALTNGRIHPSFNQLRATDEDDDPDGGEDGGAAYGRLSAAKPAIQQQPARDDHALIWRMIYLPEEGMEWASPDYSQQEPRMAVHYACKAGNAIDPNTRRPIISREAHESAMVARDAYRNDPKTDNHDMMARMIVGEHFTSKDRKGAKIIFLGLSYGMGGAKMCRSLGLPTMMAVRAPWRADGVSRDWAGRVFNVNTTEGRALLEMGYRRYEAAGPEGQNIIDEFDRRVPYVRAMARAAEQRAKSVGYITTLSGRRCRFPVAPDGNWEWTHKGFNRLLQGSSADQTKMAMVALSEGGYDQWLLIQVHDEVPLSTFDREHAEGAAEIMRHCVELEVPSKVDVEIGKTWGHSMLGDRAKDPGTALAYALGMV